MMQNIEERVAGHLRRYMLKLHVPRPRILAAVSGGADSVALAALLQRLSSQIGFELFAVTVDHKIRSSEESGGDALFVQQLCASFEPPVPCSLIALEEGEVNRTATLRGKGVEEAARYLRYRSFEQAAVSLGASCVCTAHTRNDQLETVLMRFIQGGGAASLAGIAPERGLYFRPLLDTTRAELEEWLVQHNVSWREDLSNNDVLYLRNRIRHTLVPCLDSAFPGWRQGVLGTAEKAARDEAALRSIPLPEWEKIRSASGFSLSCSSVEFNDLEPALRLRLLQDGITLLGVTERISYRYLRRIADSKGTRRMASAGMVFTDDGHSVSWSADIVHHGKSGYLVYVRSPGIVSLPTVRLAVTGSPEAARIGSLDGFFTLPLIIRSRAAGDAVLGRSNASGTLRLNTINNIFSDWGVPASQRDLVPIIETNGEISAVYGSLFGYPDWINEEIHGKE